MPVAKCWTCKDALNPSQPRPFHDMEAAAFHKQKMGLHDVGITPQTDRIRCEGCGMPIPDPGENPEPEALLCDACYRTSGGD